MSHQHAWTDVMVGNDTDGYWPAQQCTRCGEVRRYAEEAIAS